jgi:aldehyde dehydrogenase (NAD+)
MVDMSEIVERQRRFFATGATRGLEFRIARLKAFKAALSAHEDRLCQAIHADFGKSAFDTVSTELLFLHREIKAAIAKVGVWSARKRVRTPLLNFPARSWIIPEPLGVALVMGAWNYPYQLCFTPAIAAIAAGDTVVLKPSELPVRTAQAIARLVEETFDPSFFCVVQGGVPETTVLLEQRFDKIFFTGSEAVGRIVYQAAARHLTPVTLELGGKSPAIVSEDCDLGVSARRLVWAKFLNAGQTCIAPDYVLVHESILEVFLEALGREIRAQEFSLERGSYVRIVDDRHFLRLVRLLDSGRIAIGGGRDAATRWIEPTVLRDVTNSDLVMEAEIFGPILPVLVYRELDEAISLVRARPKPLSCYVFTRSRRVRERVLREILFGGGCVNDALMHITNPFLPFGGVGESGIGSYHGEAGFRAFSHHKSVLDNPTWFDPPFKYPPHSDSLLGWIHRLMD